jgi:energy-coupling factor transporter ATP-binding protein EcfA2
VAYPNDVWVPDPFDVDTIHSEARATFEQALHQAADPQASSGGRVLLLKGASGSGKTHLMRAFRAQVHGESRGYFGYMQMTSSLGQYSRYVLNKLIDSLEKPYWPGDPLSPSGLRRLADSVAQVGGISSEILEELRDPDTDPTRLISLVVQGADRLQDSGRFSDVDRDLLRAMLWLQNGRPSLHGRVLRYLRGEPLTEDDRARLADLSPRVGDDEALRLTLGLGRLIGSAEQGVLVICLDQMEAARDIDEPELKFRRAMQAVNSIAEHLGNCVVVLACLEDHYTSLSGHLTNSIRDRIEKDQPRPVTLTATRTADEIEKLVANRLEYLFEEHEASVDESDWLFPISATKLAEMVGETSRSVLTYCQDHRRACQVAGQLVDVEMPDRVQPDPIDSVDMERLEQQWNDYLATWSGPVPDSDEGLAALLGRALDLSGDELHNGYSISADATGNHARAMLANGGQPTHPSIMAGICNKSSKGTGLMSQLNALVRGADDNGNAVPVVVRCSSYPKTGSAVELIGKEVIGKRNGRKILVEDGDWRTMASYAAFHHRFAKEHENVFERWRRHYGPLSRLPSIRNILDLDALQQHVANAELNNQPAVNGADIDTPTSSESSSKVVEQPPQAEGSIVVGKAVGRPEILDREVFLRHSAFLGGSGSGKTTAALNVIEQLLLQGVPALLIDRKGDLSRYATEEAWTEPLSGPDIAAREERRRLLRDRVEVAVYTPGDEKGRPLTLPLLPAGVQVLSDHDRQKLCRTVAASLGGVLGFKSKGAGDPRVSILYNALDLLSAASDESVTLDQLAAYVDEDNAELTNAMGRMPPRRLTNLIESLDTLRTLKRHLFTAEGEPLDVARLLGLGPHATDGRTRMTIISTKALGGLDDSQFWVAQLLLEVQRWIAQSPRNELQAVLFVDEADVYLPAVGKPPTKQPMEDLLKRARSGGLGVMLATQSPGDFDYKCRDNIATWFIGRVQSDTAIGKMKPLLSDYGRDVASTLAGRATGEFFLASESRLVDINTACSAVLAQQMAVDEIARAAARLASKSV